MKLTRAAAIMLLMCGMTVRGAVSPDELIRTVDQMSPEQAQEFRQKLEAKLWTPVPMGFFRRMAIDFGGSSSSLDTVDLQSLSLSGGRMEVDRASGGDIGLLWRVFNERFRLGLRSSSWVATDANLGKGGYSRVDLSGGSLSLAANYQWVRSEACLLWTELASGSGRIAIETVDTPNGQPTTLRFFDGSFGQLDIQAGASWRFNPVLTLFMSGGYRFAESVDLDEGGITRPVKFDASGFLGRFGLGVNF